MNSKHRFRASTDKDVFDLIMSDKNRFSDANIRAIALGRGLIFSLAMDRENMAKSLSLLPHDFESVVRLVEVREHRSATEKRSYVEFGLQLSREEALRVVENYRIAAAGNEEVHVQTRRARDIYVNVSYDEIDYSKTRLIQRQRRDAGIEIVLDDERAIFRMPATEAARGIVQRMGEEISKLKRVQLNQVEIDLSMLTPEQRTGFFVAVISSVAGFQLLSVINVKVASRPEDDLDERLDEGNDEEIESLDVASKINNVALSGKNLIQSDVYQDLRKRGFFVTAISWQAEKLEPPRDVYQFDISFDQPLGGTGFKFGVRYAKRLISGEPSSNFRPLEKNLQPAVWKVVESAAESALKKVKASHADLKSQTLKEAGE